MEIVWNSNNSYRTKTFLKCQCSLLCIIYVIQKRENKIFLREKVSSKLQHIFLRIIF